MLVQRFILCPRNTFQYYNLVKHARKSTINLGSFGRVTRNFGFVVAVSVVAGCCFSRQSDEETLLPNKKDNCDLSEDQPNSQINQPNIRESSQNTETMKRGCEVLDDVVILLPSDIAAKSVISGAVNKRKMILESETEVVKKVPNVYNLSVHENAELPKKKSKESDVEGEKPKKCRPNYFVAIQISNDQIHQALKELQQHMLNQDKRVKNILIPPATLHITLMVMYLKDNEAHAKAVKVLEDIHKEHDDDLSKNPLKLEFKGLSHFGNRVLYAKLLGNDSYMRLISLYDSVIKHFEEALIMSTDSRKKFTPHLTVAKIEHDANNYRMQKQNKYPKKIDPALYKDFIDQYFGYQYVKSIQLLRMSCPKDEAGYYTGKEIFFSAFEPKVRCDSLNRMLEIEEKQKNVKEVINALLKNKV